MKNFINNRGGIYRARDGVILGVCKGVANYFDFSVFWVRIGMVVIFLLSGFWPVIGIYLVAALLMKPAPVVPLNTEAEQEFYDSYTHSRRRAARRLKRRFENLERRLQRMEHIVTTREFDWESKLEK